MEKQNEVLFEQVEEINETETAVEVYEVSESEGNGLGKLAGVLVLAAGAALGGLAWKNKDKIKQHRIEKLKKKLAKLEGETEVEEEIEEENIEVEVVDTEDDIK